MLKILSTIAAFAPVTVSFANTAEDTAAFDRYTANVKLSHICSTKEANTLDNHVAVAKALRDSPANLIGSTLIVNACGWPENEQTKGVLQTVGESFAVVAATGAALHEAGALAMVALLAISGEKLVTEHVLKETGKVLTKEGAKAVAELASQKAQEESIFASAWNWCADDAWWCAGVIGTAGLVTWLYYNKDQCKLNGQNVCQMRFDDVPVQRTHLANNYPAYVHAFYKVLYPEGEVSECLDACWGAFLERQEKADL